MKLIYCKKCESMTGLTREVRSCQCGASQGVYLDDRQAIYAGPCLPIGIHNGSFANALSWLSEDGLANEFIGFTIPADSPYFRRVDVLSRSVVRRVRERRAPD